MTPVAINSNRFNTQGQSPANFRAKTSQIISNTVPAGGRLQVPVFGNFFYLVAGSGSVGIKPTGAIEVIYSPGTGLKVDPLNTFDLLEISNPDTVNSVAFQLFIGFDEFIDKRLVISNSSQPQVVYPTAAVPNQYTVIDVPDKSGVQILDANGNKFFALQRTAILIFNLGDTDTILVQAANADAAPADSDTDHTNGGVTDAAIAAVYPLTTLRVDASGDYRLTGGVGTLNVIVSEIYTAIPDTTS